MAFIKRIWQSTYLGAQTAIPQAVCILVLLISRLLSYFTGFLVPDRCVVNRCGQVWAGKGRKQDKPHVICLFFYLSPPT